MTENFVLFPTDKFDVFLHLLSVTQFEKKNVKFLIKYVDMSEFSGKYLWLCTTPLLETLARLICTLIILGCRRALIFLGCSLKYFMVASALFFFQGGSLKSWVSYL